MNNSAKTPPLVLVFAASDPTSGAGLQADLLTAAANGCHALTVVTGLTVQDTSGVHLLEPVDEDLIEDQARALLEDMPISAIKLGVLASEHNIRTITQIISDYDDIPIVLDPVLASGRGDALSDDDMVQAMVSLLLPICTVITPNTVEARRLVDAASNEDVSTVIDAIELGKRLIEYGAQHVLLTGTHEASDQVINRLFDPKGTLLQSHQWPRLPDTYHGSGCTLATSLACHLAHGLPLAQASLAAQQFTWTSLEKGFRAGLGQALPNRMFAHPSWSSSTPTP